MRNFSNSIPLAFTQNSERYLPRNRCMRMVLEELDCYDKNNIRERGIRKYFIVLVCILAVTPENNFENISINLNFA